MLLERAEIRCAWESSTGMNRATARQAARRGRDDDEWMLKKVLDVLRL